MPSTQTITTYKFHELSDAAKENARNWYRNGALDYEWWETTYEDAARIGLEITGFDLDRQSIDARFTLDSLDVARAILKEHGEGCDTAKLATEFIAELESSQQAGGAEEGATEDQDREFLRALKEEYWHMLEKESEYLTSDEAVDDGIVANDYDFTYSGSRRVIL